LQAADFEVALLSTTMKHL